MRIQLKVPKHSAKNIKKLMAETGTDTYRELFSNALTLLEWSVQQVQSGRIIASLDESEMKYKELVMPALKTAEIFHTRKKAQDGVEKNKE